MREDNFESPGKEIDVKLVREIEKFMYHLELRENTPPFPDEYIDDTTFYKIALHFYELGQKDATSKFDEIEYNRQRAEEEMLDKSLDEAAKEYVQKGHLLPEAFIVIPTFKEGAKWQKEKLMKGAEEEMFDKTLDEVADEYAYSVYPSEGVANIEICDAFKDGAKWQKEQMMKEAVEEMVKYHDYPEYKYVLVPYEEFNDGDKVRVIIVKEEDK